MHQYSQQFYEAMKDYVLHDKQGEVGTFLGQPLYSSRPLANIAVEVYGCL